MSAPFVPSVQLTSEQQQVLNRIVQSFEQSWIKGERPVIEKFLPVEGPADLRRAVLVELVHIDHESRHKAGDEAGSQDYISRFPELSAETAPLKDLAQCRSARDLRMAADSLRRLSRWQEKDFEMNWIPRLRCRVAG